MITHWLDGVEADVESKLRENGIRSVHDLLLACPRPGDVVTLANKAGLDPAFLTGEWNRAKLQAIRGIGVGYISLLEEAGISTADDLAKFSPEDLRQKISAINAEKKLVGRVPALAMVNGWVNKAQRISQAR